MMKCNVERKKGRGFLRLLSLQPICMMFCQAAHVDTPATAIDADGGTFQRRGAQ